MASKTAAFRLRAAERREYVMWLRKGGMSYSRIARDVISRCQGQPMPHGYDGPPLNMEHFRKTYEAPQVWADLKVLLDAAAARIAENTDAYRSELGEQLDEMLSVSLSKAQAGDLYGVQVALQVAQTKARLLGLNKPELRQVSGPEGGPVPISIIREAQAAAAGSDDD